MEDNYSKYRGKCKEFVDEAIKKDPTLIAVRGYYYDTFWGKQEHWWCRREDGTIYDPTKLQFPTQGNGEYEEFDGYMKCSECGKVMKEEDAKFESNYCFCSTKCHLIFVGLGEYV